MTGNWSKIWASRFNGFFGDQMQEIAMVWIAWEISQSATFTGLAALSSRVPNWLFGIPVGIIVDRFSRQGIVIWANLGRAVVSGLMLWSYFDGFLDEAMLLTASFLISTFSMIEAPAFTALVPQLVPQKDVSKANAVTDNSKRIARLIGPIVSTYLGRSIAVPWYYLIIALNYLATSILSATFDCKPSSGPKREAPTMTYLIESVLILRRYKPILVTVVCFSIYNISYGAGFVLLPVLFGGEKGFGVEGFSIIMTGYGTGALLVSIYFSFRHQAGFFYMPFLGFLLVSMSLFMIVFAPDLTVAFAIGIIGGMGLPMMDIFVPTLIHHYGRPEHFGRIYAGWRLLVDFGMSIGFAAAGFVADFWSPAAALAMFSLLPVPIILISVIKMHGLVSAEDGEDD